MLQLTDCYVSNGSPFLCRALTTEAESSKATAQPLCVSRPNLEVPRRFGAATICTSLSSVSIRTVALRFMFALQRCSIVGRVITSAGRRREQQTISGYEIRQRRERYWALLTTSKAGSERCCAESREKKGEVWPNDRLAMSDTTTTDYLLVE